MDESRSARNIGLVLMGFGVLLNPLFIGWALSPSGSVERAPTLIFIIFAELFLVSAGGFFVIRKASLPGRTAWFSLVLFFIIPPAVEIGLQGLRLAQHLLRPAALDKRMALSAYRDKPWGRELFREMHELTFVYKQYLGWRTKEYHGVWINVDGDGLRRTTGGFPEDGQDQARVYMFGGSSMWGAYARDGNTIPSLLARRAREAGVRVRFSNFAEQGYTFTQEVLRLLLLIREGKTPDAVVFYDGFNDVVTAETSGRPGSTSLTAQFEELVESRHMGFLKQLGWAAHALITQECMLYKSAESLAALAGLRWSSQGDVRRYDQSGLDSLGSGIVREYLHTHAMLDSLSHTYHFTYACVLQPILYTKLHLSGEEETVDERVHDDQLRALFLLTYGALQKAHVARWFDLTRVFDSHAESVYIDLCHVSEEGDEALADSLFAVVRWTIAGREGASFGGAP